MEHLLLLRDHNSIWWDYFVTPQKENPKKGFLNLVQNVAAT